MRHAFENIEVGDGSHPLIPMIMKALRSRIGTFTTSGWKVVNRRGRHGKRRSKRAVS